MEKVRGSGRWCVLRRRCPKYLDGVSQGWAGDSGRWYELHRRCQKCQDGVFQGYARVEFWNDGQEKASDVEPDRTSRSPWVDWGSKSESGRLAMESGVALGCTSHLYTTLVEWESGRECCRLVLEHRESP